ncbi:MAG: peptide deformylase [Minisyncoccia bacterium]
MPIIVQKEDPVLRRVAETVNPKDFNTPALSKILADMATALEKEEDGVAIAAPQIGVPLRIFLVSHRAFEYIDEETADELKESGAPIPPQAQMIRRSNMAFITPVITKLSRKKNGCPRGASRYAGSTAKSLAQTRQPYAPMMKMERPSPGAGAVFSHKSFSTKLIISMVRSLSTLLAT